MSWLNPVCDKFKVEFIGDFFTSKYLDKYNQYLYNKNSPLKDIMLVLKESIQNLVVPGFSLSPLSITGLANSGNNPYGGSSFPNPTLNQQYPGTQPQSEIWDSTTLNITFRNNIINYMMLYELFYLYVQRDRKIGQFNVVHTVLDSAEIPIFNFKFGGVFLQGMAGLEFATNNGFREAKTIEAVFAFNTLDVEFVVPGFEMEVINLINKKKEPIKF